MKQTSPNPATRLKRLEPRSHFNMGRLNHVLFFEGGVDNSDFCMKPAVPAMRLDHYGKDGAENAVISCRATVSCKVCSRFLVFDSKQ